MTGAAVAGGGGGGPGGGPFVVLIIIISSFWFGNHIFRSIDRFYQPSVQRWADQRPSLSQLGSQSRLLFQDDDDTCAINDNDHEDCGGVKNDGDYGRPNTLRTTKVRSPVDEEYERLVEQELLHLTQMNGLTGPDPGGSRKARIKAQFLAKMNAINEDYKMRKIAEQEHMMLMQKETKRQDQKILYQFTTSPTDSSMAHTQDPTTTCRIADQTSMTTFMSYVNRLCLVNGYPPM